MGDSDDDVPVSSLIKRKLDYGAEPITEEPSAKIAAVAAPKKDDELPEWWDDELSIVALMARRAKVIKDQSLKKFEALRAAEKDKPKPQKKEKKESSASSSSASSEKGRPQGNNKPADYYETKKGQILQALLVRWWYAYDWPLPEEIGKPPAGYEEMDGFPGVFVSFNLDSLGNILDLRDKKNCPSLANLSKRPASELQEMCLSALTKQLEQLQEAEGEDAALCLVLKKKMKEIKGINAEEAEREVVRGGSKYCF